MPVGTDSKITKTASKQTPISIDEITDWASQYLSDEAKCISLAQADPSFFCSYIMRDPDTLQHFVQDLIHWEGHQLISNNKWAMIEFPREHGKTEQFGIGRMLWELGKNHNHRIKIVSNVDEEALNRVSAIGEHIEQNDRVRKVFPDLLPDYNKGWTKGSINIQKDVAGTKDASVRGYGVLASATGGRCSILMMDDVCDLENTIVNPAKMDKVDIAWRNKWLNLLTEIARVIYLFTRWHERDLSHRLIKSNVVVVDDVTKPANTGLEQFAYIKRVIDPDNIVSISKLWPVKRLKARRKSGGERAFARGFCGQAMTDDEQIFSAIDTHCRYNVSVDDMIPQYPRFTGVDVGHRDNEKSAFTAFFTAAVTPDLKKVPVDIERGRWKPDVMADKLVLHAMRNNSTLVLVENNGAQDMLRYLCKAPMIEHKRTFPIKGHFTGKQKMDEDLGLPAMQVDQENGNWIIPMADMIHDTAGAICPCMTCEWIREMKAWPIGEYFDLGMASWLCYTACDTRRIGTGVKSSDKKSDFKEGMEDYGETEKRIRTGRRRSVLADIQ